VIPRLHDPALGEGAALGLLAARAYRLPAELPPAQAVDFAERIARCARTLIDGGSSAETPARAFAVPGRIEVLGKHTDYAGGRSLLAAVERGFVLVSVARPDERVRISALDAGGAADFGLSARLTPSPGWRNYPMTVARRLARDFPGLATGADVALHSDLPAASGMSSSSALVVGTFLCLASAHGFADHSRFRAEVRDADDLASYLAAVESGQGFGGLAGDAGVGTHGGSEDHTAILRAEAGRLLQYRFVPATLERVVALPAGYRFAIASSGVAAEKTGAMKERYNRASALVRALREIWREAGGAEAPSLAAAMRSSLEAPDRLRRAVRAAPGAVFPVEDLLARLDHLLAESELIVPAAVTALAAGDLAGFGARVDESQRRAETLLGNQVPETIELARSARDLGAAAASAFGAGYGGSVWALVAEAEMEPFLGAWRKAYAPRFPAAAPASAFFSSGAGAGAQRLA
jgi:galactokinase